MHTAGLIRSNSAWDANLPDCLVAFTTLALHLHTRTDGGGDLCDVMIQIESDLNKHLALYLGCTVTSGAPAGKFWCTKVAVTWVRIILF